MCAAIWQSPIRCPSRRSSSNGLNLALCTAVGSKTCTGPNVARRRPVIRRTVAGVSVLYRALLAPYDLAGADQMCDGLKAHGGQCIVHRIDPEE